MHSPCTPLCGFGQSVYDSGMATGLLQNQTWNVGRAGKQCAGCQMDLAPGSACWAALVEWPATEQRGKASEARTPYERLDFCMNCWDSGKRPTPPAEMFSWWKAQITHEEKKRNLFVDDSVLIDLFNRLADKTDMQDLRFRFVLALLLMRKRLLRYEGTTPLTAAQEQQFANINPQPEIWRMLPRGTQSEALVVNPHLTTEQIAEVSGQLSGILAEEV